MMNTILKQSTAILLCLCLVFGLSACHKNEEPELDAIDQVEGIITGSWEEADSPVVTSELQAKLEQAAEDVVGATYTPVAYLGSQIVSGRNYLLLCRVAPVVADPVETYAIVTLYEDAEGKLQLVSTSDFGVETYMNGENLLGGWSEPETPELTDEAKEAFEKAAAARTDILYHPVALLSQQVVAGMNYRILCEADDTIPGYDMNYAILTVYHAADGSAEITDIVPLAPEE